MTTGFRRAGGQGLATAFGLGGRYEQMSALRRALLALLLAVVVCAGSPSPRALAATEVVIANGGFMDVAIDPGSGRGVAISSDLAPGSRPGNMTMRLYASALDATGRPSGAANLFGDGFSPDFMGPHLIAMATDVRRGRYLVAYTATKPGMGSSPCEPLPTPPPGAIVFPTDPQRQCAIVDQEIFVRVLDRAGRAVGPERQITSVGAPASGLFRSGAPNVSYDARSDSYGACEVVPGADRLRFRRGLHNGLGKPASAADPALSTPSARRTRWSAQSATADPDPSEVAGS